MSVPFWYLLISGVLGWWLNNKRPTPGPNPNPTPNPDPVPNPGPGPSLLDLLKRLLDDLAKKREEVAQAEGLVRQISIQEAPKRG